MCILSICSSIATRLCRSWYTGLLLRSMTTSVSGISASWQVLQGPLRLLEFAEKNPVFRTHALEFAVGIRRTCSWPDSVRAFMVSSSPAPMCLEFPFQLFALGADLVLFLRRDFWRSLRRSRRCCWSLLTTSSPIGVHDGVDDRRRVVPVGFGGAHLHDAGDSSTESRRGSRWSARRWHCASHPRADAGSILQSRDRGGPP